MDFQNVNPLNVWINFISGNLFPMTADDTSFPVLWKIYSILLWLLELVQMCVLIRGCILVPKERALKDGLIGLAITIEVVFIVVRIQTRRGLIQQLIQNLNDILRTKDEIMRNIVIGIFKPIKAPFKFYLIDYRMPVIFSKEPFSITTFVAGSLLVMTSSVYIFIKKVSVDSYMTHLILLITAQYKYTALKLAMIFQGAQNNCDDASEAKSYDMNQYAKKKIKIICQQHNAVLHMTFLLRELLSSNLSIMYLNNVFRFCCIVIMVISIPHIGAFEGFIFITYAMGGIIQLYIVCSCMQQLLDASTELTDQAFHEGWYRFSVPIKRMLIFIIMANNIEPKIAMFERYNMSLSSFMTILNQSYSIALLLLRTN
ncbi:uncharacterized protein LOC105283093 isoform X2 [Ooceraea biroi]|uniref:uncharacterized protein LOC105283093 isoform X2 n=1 Tax=Ooceraea biroi TaxID=2015173 RepID=UPI000F095A9B|nr:uncharacterized protein LOC105283093 isoform X2 [Ooceraea biroi]